MRFLIRTVYGCRTAYGSSTLYEMSRASEQPRRGRSGGHPEDECSTRSGSAPEPSGRRAPQLARRHRRGRRSPSPTPRGIDAVSMRRVASRARARDDEPLPLRARQGRAARPHERRDPRGPARRRRRAAEAAGAPGCAPSRSATRANFERHPWIMRRPAPAPARDPGPQLAAPHRPVARGGRRPRRSTSEPDGDHRVVDDYVFGFVAARLASPRTRPARRTPCRVDAGRLRPPAAARSRAARSPICTAASRPTARPAATTRTSRDGLERGALRARARAPARRHRGEVRQAGQAASWKMTPSVVRRPECTVATPWRMVAR